MTSTSRPAALHDPGASNNNHVPVANAAETTAAVTTPPPRLDGALAELHTVIQRIGNNVERVRSDGADKRIEPTMSVRSAVTCASPSDTKSSARVA